MKKKPLIVFALIVCLLLVNVGSMFAAEAEEIKVDAVLPANDSTTWVGYFDNSRAPVLTINSGDVLETQTWTLYNDRFSPGVTMEEILAMRKELAAENKTMHTLTGPVYVNGAMPGDVLEIKYLKLVPRPYAKNLNWPGKLAPLGTLPEDFPEGQVKDLVLDLETMTTKFNEDITLEIKPFFGIMAVAPDVDGWHSTSPPMHFGGNIDCRELTEGSTLYLPVFKEGALLVYGDAHALQGDGEVNLTAAETAFDQAIIQVTVRKDMSLSMPFAETATHWITFGFNEDLDTAAKDSLRQMISFLENEKGLSAHDAYSLCSLSASLRVTQLVDGNKGIHTMLPKAIFTEGK